jgi:hypothetical protein
MRLPVLSGVIEEDANPYISQPGQFRHSFSPIKWGKNCPASMIHRQEFCRPSGTIKPDIDHAADLPPPETTLYREWWLAEIRIRQSLTWAPAFSSRARVSAGTAGMQPLMVEYRRLRSTKINCPIDQ